MTRTDQHPRASRGRLRPVPDSDRQPPHNLEAEEAVLGAVLASGQLLAEVAALLEEADFYRPAHRAIWRSDGTGWNLPSTGSPTGWPQSLYGPVPAGHHLPENSQNGQAGLAGGAGRDVAGGTKRQRIEEYLDWLGPEQLRNLTVRELTTDLASQGLEVTERYVKQILDQQRPPPQPQRRRGSGARKPRR